MDTEYADVSANSGSSRSYGRRACLPCAALWTHRQADVSANHPAVVPAHYEHEEHVYPVLHYGHEYADVSASAPAVVRALWARRACLPCCTHWTRRVC
jgi:hypothetical protein